ncbi:MAG: radical SAM protein, partial [Oscillospiraceae bacterium]|nr:radical SAM protein [Oscillospiraceae bacterium]
ELSEVLAPCPAPALPQKQAEAAAQPLAGKTAQVMAISRHRMGTDGEGVCTLVGLWGCPMRCRDCFNPGCFTPQPSAALHTAPQLLEKLKQDSPYFLMSGGGVTFGGGEPLLSAGFILEFCRLADPRWKIRLETSLNCDYSLIAPLVPYVDKWYVDIKALDPALYFDYTAGMNDRVAPNLARLKEEAGAEKILLRIPYGRGFKAREQALEEQQQLCGQGYYTQVFEYMVPEGVKQEKRIGVYYENPSPRPNLWAPAGGERIGLLNYRQESLPKEPEEEEWMGDLMLFFAKKDDPPQTANPKKKKRRQKR